MAEQSFFLPFEKAVSKSGFFTSLTMTDSFTVVFRGTETMEPIFNDRWAE